MFYNKLGCCPRTTVFVLDRSSRFLSQSKQHIDLDGSGKSKSQAKGMSKFALGPVYKNAWTCCMEATVEYCRIVYDLFPTEYMVQIIVSDEKAQKINAKSQDQQNVPYLLRTFANLGPPKPDNEEECSMMHGLTTAVQCVGEAVPQHKQQSERCSNEDGKTRIICLTTLKNEAHVNTLVACVNDALQHQTSSCPVQNLDLTLIHIINANDSNKFSDKIPKVSPSLSVSVHSIKSSQLVFKLSLMVQKHFTLKSTTVTGIPMKEEQHSGSSANYDVEILHAAEVHHDLKVFNQFCSNSTTNPAAFSTNIIISGSTSGKKDGAAPKETVILKWCTPKNSSPNELYPCLGSYRITPVEVNSRPTSCLISFLLQGRYVMLEQPRKSGSKVVSNILMSHGGDIYIHSVSTSRTPNEDPPSISEGMGGRVTDYRINDFGEFMKSNRLAPWSKKKGQANVNVLEKSHSRLERCTRHWPVVISDTIIGNMMPHLEPLVTLIMKEVLTEKEVLDCKGVIYRLQSMESRNDVLPITMTGVRGKGPKRDEQYRQLWLELDVFLEAASKTSKMHEKVYDCLKVSQSPSQSSHSSPMRTTPTEDIERANVGAGYSVNDMAWKEIDRYHTMSERERTDFNRGDTNNDHFLKRGRNTPDIERAQKKFKPDERQELSQRTGLASSGPSLLSLWTNKMNSTAAKRHDEFAGRMESDGCKADLYQHLNVDSSGGSGRGTPVKEWPIS